MTYQEHLMLALSKIYQEYSQTIQNQQPTYIPDKEKADPIMKILNHLHDN